MIVNNIISVIICTRNRAFILPDCLDSLLDQTISTKLFEVVLVDNASADQTHDIAERYATKFENFSYIPESKTGLSHARNTGYKQAQGDWVVYLDDDARASTDFIERALWTINQFDFDLFGGMYYAWFKFGRPRWLPENYGTKEKLLEKAGYLEQGFASGGIMAVKKEVIEKVGGFIPQLGMKSGLGYGEEDDFQIRLRSKNYKIGFDPDWSIDHCVLPEKLNLSWHFRSAFAQGRDQAKIFERYSATVILYGLLRSTFGILWKLPITLVKCFFDKSFYWENVLWDLFIPITFQVGRLRGWLVRRSGSTKD